MKIAEIKVRVAQALNSRNGRNTLTFIVFLCIATLFWFLMSLNDDVQRDYELPVRIEGLPSDMTLLTGGAGSPVAINVSVRDKGANQLPRRFKHNTLNIDYRDFTDKENNRLTLSSAQLNNCLRQMFGSTATIITQTPDSLSIPYTTLPPTTVAIKPLINITPKPQFIQNGPIKLSVDSVKLYSSSPQSQLIKYIYTDELQRSSISDTTTVTVKLQVPAGCRAVPDHVKVTIPVEPLVSKTIIVPVEPVGNPDGTTMITFPATVAYTCLIPMSQFNLSSYPMKAYADYSKRNGNSIELDMSLIPENYMNGALSPTSVEFIIEH